MIDCIILLLRIIQSRKQTRILKISKTIYFDAKKSLHKDFDHSIFNDKRQSFQIFDDFQQSRQIKNVKTIEKICAFCRNIHVK